MKTVSFVKTIIFSLLLMGIYSSFAQEAISEFAWTNAINDTICRENMSEYLMVGINLIIVRILILFKKIIQ